jgi:hypothetical protein
MFCTHGLGIFIGHSHPVEDVVFLRCLEVCRSHVASESCNPLVRRSPNVRNLNVFDRVCGVRIVRARCTSGMVVVHVTCSVRTCL